MVIRKQIPRLTKLNRIFTKFLDQRPVCLGPGMCRLWKILWVTGGFVVEIKPKCERKFDVILRQRG